jgi:hypothetical protein
VNYSVVDEIKTEEPQPVECWNCGRVILSATGWIQCTCGCSQSYCNANTYPQNGFDPDFAATASCPA